MVRFTNTIRTLMMTYAALKRLVESDRSGIVMMDADLTISYASPSIARTGTWDVRSCAREMLRHTVELYRQVMNTVCETDPEGRPLWLECTCVNMLDDAGERIIVCMYRDISEQKSAENILRQTVQELSAYKHALDESSIVAITDHKGLIQHVNDNFCRISKYSREELVGKDHRIINSGYHDKSVIRDLWSTIARGKVWKGELKNRAKDGSYYWVDTTIVPFLNERGKPYQYLAIRSDITERKIAELELQGKTALIQDMLESIADGFIAVDEHLCYTYVNQQLCNMLGMTSEQLLGRHMWDVFPDAVGSATYTAIQSSLLEKRYVSNEDYYAPLNLWQENRIYPAGPGLSIFIRDISVRKREEHRLKLLESVITNTNDAVMITEAEPIDEPGPRILYVNEAFTRMTGYTADEVIGQSPRILQGPNTDRAELDRLHQALASWEACEATVVNYGKYGQEFCIHMSISPVMDEKGRHTHWIAIERDVTHSKNKELRKGLLADIGLIFNNGHELETTMLHVLRRLVEFGNIVMAEAWLIGADKHRINLFSRYARTEAIERFFRENGALKHFAKGQDMAGAAWETQRTTLWTDAGMPAALVRGASAVSAGMESVYAVPLSHNQEIIGVLVLGMSAREQWNEAFRTLIADVGTLLGPEIKRKQLERELKQLFELAPDSICIAGTDGYIKKVNPAMCALLEYSENEVLNIPFISFIYPGDAEIILQKFSDLRAGNHVTYFEGRLISRSGDIRWMAWTATPLPEEGLFFCVAKDISYKKELEELLQKANGLARIGGWEIDLQRQTVYWSSITREIHEVEPDFEPDNHTAMLFYREGDDRRRIVEKITEAMESGIPCDVEVQIVTAKGNVKWIRAIGEAEFRNGVCARVYGSFQDIDDRKRAEIVASESLEILSRQAKELAISNDELEQFAYVASHDLQEPLRMVNSFLTQLEKKYADVIDAKGKQYIYFAVDGAKRMRQIILDLLEFSRVGRTVNDREIVPLDELADDVVGLYRKQVEEKMATIEIEPLPVLLSFKAPLRQVLQNLIGNALKYQASDSKPFIRVSSIEQPTYWEFAVTDNGIGIEAEYFDKIFVIFQRLHNKDEYSGTGMGLSVTRKIVESMGGKIWVESMPGQGSTFRFTISKIDHPAAPERLPS